jgi:hypothetical protein
LSSALPWLVEPEVPPQPAQAAKRASTEQKRIMVRTAYDFLIHQNPIPYRSIDQEPFFAESKNAPPTNAPESRIYMR